MAATTSTWGCDDGDDIDTGLQRRRHRHGAAATTSTWGCGCYDDIDTGLREQRRRHKVVATEQATMSPESLSNSPSPSVDFDISEEGLAIRIAVEVANLQEKKSAPGKAYAVALCKVAVLLRFRQSEQIVIKCMRGLVSALAASANTHKDLVKELAQMASRLKSLDEHPEEELPQDQADAIFGLDGGIKLDANPVVPPTPAPRSVRAAPTRRRARRAPSSSDDSEAEAEAELESLDITSVSRVPATPSMTAARSQRASKTAALSKFASAAPSDSEQGEGQSDVTTDEDPSDEESP